MELSVMELEMGELNKVSGGDTAGPEHEKIVKLTKKPDQDGQEVEPQF